MASNFIPDRNYINQIDGFELRSQLHVIHTVIKLPIAITVFLIGLIGSQITVTLYYLNDYKEIFNNRLHFTVLFI